VSKLGIEEGSCFLCGAIVLAGFSTAASAMVEEGMQVRVFERSETGSMGR
jgi:hypothetical protein